MSETTLFQSCMRGSKAVTNKISKSTFLIITITLTTLILFSGCGDDDNNRQARINCSNDDTLCIGLFPQQRDVRSFVSAAEFAREDINSYEDDEINVRFITRESDPLVTAPEHIALAQELLDSGIEGMVGPESSQEVLRVFDFLVQNELVAVSPSATSLEITNENIEVRNTGGTPYFFRTVVNDMFQAQILVGQIRAQTDPPDLLIVAQRDAYADNLTELITAQIPTDKVVRYELYDSNDPMFNERTQAVINDIENVDGIASVSSIILILSGPEGGSIIRGMLDSETIPDTAQYYITDSLAVANLHERVDPDDPSRIEGFKATTPCALSDPTDRIAEFQQRFPAEQRDSLQFASHTYDAVITVALASLSAGSQDPAEYVSHMRTVTSGGTQCRTYAECAALLTDDDTTNDNIDYEGISGPVDFDENGDVESGWYFIYTYDGEGGRQREICHVPDLNCEDGT